MAKTAGMTENKKAILTLAASLRPFAERREPADAPALSAFERDMLFELASSALPFLNDCLAGNLASPVSYRRLRSVLLSAAVLSRWGCRKENDGFASLVRDSAVLAADDAYRRFMPDFVSGPGISAASASAYAGIARLAAELGLGADGFRASNPLLLGFTPEKTIRIYLGYEYEAMYAEAGRLLCGGRDDSESKRYVAAVSDAVMKMLAEMVSELGVTEKDRKTRKGGSRPMTPALANVYRQESLSVQALSAKLGILRPGNRICPLLRLYLRIESSFAAVSLHKQISQVPLIFQSLLEWQVIAEQAASEAFASSSGRDEPAGDRLSPEICLSEDRCLAYLDRLAPSLRCRFGLRRTDYLKLYYLLSSEMSQTSGLYCYPPSCLLTYDGEPFAALDELFIAWLRKLSEMLQPRADISVEAEAVCTALGRKDLLILKNP